LVEPLISLACHIHRKSKIYRTDQSILVAPLISFACHIHKKFKMYRTDQSILVVPLISFAGHIQKKINYTENSPEIFGKMLLKSNYAYVFN